MRRRKKTGPLSVHAIAGSYVTLLGIDMDEKRSKGVLGFAIERIDHTSKDRHDWLAGVTDVFEDITWANSCASSITSSSGSSPQTRIRAPRDAVVGLFPSSLPTTRGASRTIKKEQ